MDTHVLNKHQPTLPPVGEQVFFFVSSVLEEWFPGQVLQPDLELMKFSGSAVDLLSPKFG